MFTFDTAIDAVQNGKKTLVNAFVLDSNVKEVMVNFIDAQTAYTKDAVKAGTDMMYALSKESYNAMQKLGKFDYSK